MNRHDQLLEAMRIYQIALEQARCHPTEDGVWEELAAARAAVELAWLEWMLHA